MASTKKSAPAKATRKKAERSLEAEVKAVITSLKRLGNKRTRDGMARYAIPSDKAFGVSFGVMQQLAKSIGRNHELALALWDTEWYEARMMASFLDEPARVTPAQMDRWCRDFDNWAIVDTVCFKLFDQTPHAFRKVDQWARLRDEFGKRAAYVLLACLALHAKEADDKLFAERLPMIEGAASDERNFVKKGVSWALRAIGGRSRELKTAAEEVAERLANSPHAAARWVGKDALREFRRPPRKGKSKWQAKTAFIQGRNTNGRIQNSGNLDSD